MLLLALLLVVLAIVVGRWSGAIPMTHATESESHTADLVNEDGSWKYTNKLANETSPYLLQHAHNPVDWYPWGQEAFEQARRENKPIFLSIGYSTCFWCHVMERECFEKSEIAEEMNEFFVSIKVDREERPDVDDVYMMATQMMSGSGGWPMSVFLTPPGANGADDPGLKPFFAGTYFPPESRYGRPGFPEIMAKLSEAWRDRNGEVVEQAEKVAAAVSAQLRNRDESGSVDASLVQIAANQLLGDYDHTHGGFGSGQTKFPTPNYLTFLLAVYRGNPDPDLGTAIRHTLDRMARGGMYDQVGGGFHRYSVDEQWLVPHFEKMLYDNGQLVELYAGAYALWAGDPEQTDQTRLYARIVRESCDYVLGEMTDKTGAFWSAQDAEANTREGQSYLWTRDQVEAAIKNEELSELAVTMYGLDAGTNFIDPHHPEDGRKNVLFLPRPLSALADNDGPDFDALLAKRQMINSQLKLVRDTRDQPATDDKVLTGWNGLMIGGMAVAGRILDEPGYVAAAARAADAVVEHMSTDDGGLYRTFRVGQAKIPAFLEDYVFFVHGLIELHRAQPDESRWLELAGRYTQIAIGQFEADGGGYYDMLDNQADLFVRTRGTYDGAVPTANSQMVHNLVDLFELTGDRAYADRVAQDLRSFAQSLRRSGRGMCHMQHALLRALQAAPGHFTDGGVAPVADSAPVKAKVVPAVVSLAGGPATVTVTLEIDRGYHINSSAPSEDFLIGTDIRLARGSSDLAIDVEYPEGELKTYPLFPEKPLSVYEGTVSIKVSVSATAAAAAGDPKLLLRYQACTDSMCLVPETVELPLTIRRTE